MIQFIYTCKSHIMEKSLVDAGFAFVKRLYRRSEVDSMRQLASVVCKSSVGN